MNDTEKGINGGILKYVTMPIWKRIPDFLNNITAHVMHDFLWLCTQRRPFFVSGGGGVLIRYQLPEYFSYYLIHKTLFIKSLWNENTRIKILALWLSNCRQTLFCLKNYSYGLFLSANSSTRVNFFYTPNSAGYNLIRG